jgi:hypothetical protein
MFHASYLLEPWLREAFAWLRDEKSLAAATWGLVIATFLLYLDSRTRGKTQDKQWEQERELRIKEQDERWAREDQLRMHDAKPKAVVEIAEKRNASEVIFQCFNLGSTAFFIDRLIVTLSATGTTLTEFPEGPPILLPGTSVLIPFSCKTLLRSDGGFVEANAVIRLRGASGVEKATPVWFYYWSEPGEMSVHDWNVGRLSDRKPGALVEQPRRIP